MVSAKVGDVGLGTSAHGDRSSSRSDLGARCLDSDGGAVHVHLTVTDLVEPSPSKDGITTRSVSGELEVEAGLASKGAVSDVGVDDLPGGSLVKRERSLARSPAMVGSASDGHLVALSGSPLGNGLAGGSSKVLVVTLARVVGTGALERRGHAVVDVAASVLVELGAERRRVLHLHVSMGDGGHTGDGGASAEKLHFRLLFLLWEQE